MATEIKCEKKLIQEIFELWYRIPEYQRPYVWESDQVKELLEDTMGAYHSNPDAQYFLGSMVLKINEKKDGGVSYTEYELLDGQQRLTTMFLIFAAVRDLVDKTKYDQVIDVCRKAIFQEKNKYKSQPERIRIVFDIREDVKEFVEKHVKTEGGTSDDNELEKKAGAKTENISIRNMAGAILSIKSFLKENENEIEDYFTFFLNKVLMIYVATEELQDAFQLFTVLNNRGVKLSNSDILKAENLKEVPLPHDRTEWAKKWEVMESYFGENFDKFLSHIRTILVKKKATVGLLKEFDDNVYSNRIYNRTTKEYESRTPLLNRGEDTFRFIYRFYNTYMELFDKDHYEVNRDFEIYNYLRLMSDGLGTDYWVAPVLDYYNKFKTSSFCDFLKALDRKVSADWICALSPTMRIENVNAILQEIDKCNLGEDVLASSALEINISDFERIIKLDVYGKRFARYLMLKLDLLYQGNFVQFNPPATISIEHILPQNPSAGSGWMNDFTEEERYEWTDKIGNLALISRRKNASQGNLDFEDKMKRYFEKNIEVFPNSIRIFKEYTSWKLPELKQNHDNVVKKLMEAYR